MMGMAGHAQAAARMLLHDWNDGRIAYYTLPPQRPDHGHASAEVVPAWSAGFNADEARLAPRLCTARPTGSKSALQSHGHRTCPVASC